MFRVLILHTTESDEVRAVCAHLATRHAWQICSAPIPRVWARPRDRPDLLVVAPEPAGAPLVSELVEVLQRGEPDIPILAVLPAHATESEIVGFPEVDDMLIGPTRPEEICARARRLADRARARTIETITEHLMEIEGLETLVSRDPGMLALKAKLPLIAKTDATAIIMGETGTGKELIARAIHHLSSRASRPFIPLNCGAVPVELFENELFGHGRGAFTDARTASEGLIAHAEGGTLFLDEIDSMPLPAQVKLLRFMQDRVYRPLGSGRPRRADVRIIAATNTDLEGRISAGTFRQDLYYRLNVIPLALPALRHRRDDIPLLVNHFIGRHAVTEVRGRWRVAPDALSALSAYDWPGNVRQLENVVQQVLALNTPSRIHRAALPEFLRIGVASIERHRFRDAKAEAVAVFEREYARRLLLAHDGNVTRAAAAAGKERRAFGRLVKKYGIDRAFSGGEVA
jgi:two-component system, NtrC family, response regulator GlrR